MFLVCPIDTYIVHDSLLRLGAQNLTMPLVPLLWRSWRDVFMTILHSCQTAGNRLLWLSWSGALLALSAVGSFLSGFWFVDLHLLRNCPSLATLF
jgi:hypothetical protein